MSNVSITLSRDDWRSVQAVLLKAAVRYYLDMNTELAERILEITPTIREAIQHPELIELEREVRGIVGVEAAPA